MHFLQSYSPASPASRTRRFALSIPNVLGSNAARLGRRERRVNELLQRCGVELNGAGPYSLRVHDSRFYAEALRIDGAGIRDAYVAGLWDTDHLDKLTHRFLVALRDLSATSRLQLLWLGLSNALRNPQSARRAFRGSQHYQLGDALFQAMLDRRQVYSCAYFRRHDNLDDAQEAKLDLICRKLQLRSGMRLLDIGCGWGGLAQFAAERYGVRVVGITLSLDQARLALRRCAGLPVEIQLRSYHALRSQDGPFDAIASIGMFEHVGPRNYARYFRTARALLKPHGLFLLQAIGSAQTLLRYDPWMERNIFPHAHLPSIKQIGDAIDGRWVVEDLHNFGADYDKTLMAWHQRFERAWPSLRRHYDERFRRMWNCYLLTSAGAFRARQCQLWQMVMSPEGVIGGYESVR